jgi:predicted RNA methylase
MSLWSFVSAILWEEAPAADEPAARSAQAATGAPGFLRGAVRFAVAGCSAMVLTAQVAGIRLAARVDADPSYCVVLSEKCKAACPKGAGNAACVKTCNDERDRCRREQA